MYIYFLCFNFSYFMYYLILIKFIVKLKFQSMQLLSPMVCKIHFMDGKTKGIGVMPCDTITEVLNNVAKKIGLRSVEGWSINEVSF